MRNRVTTLAIALLLGTAAPGAAQVAWDSPTLVPPGAPPGFGIFLIDAHAGGIGVLGTWRSAQAAPGIGLRVGLVEGRRDGVAFLSGVDFTGRMTRASADFPLDIDWVFGAGLGVDRWTRVSFPLGLTLGHTFRGDGVTFLPYVTPRVVVDANFGRRPRSSMDLGLAVDLGLDLGLAPGWAIRFGGSLADRSAVAIGLAFR